MESPKLWKFVFTLLACCFLGACGKHQKQDSGKSAPAPLETKKIHTARLQQLDTEETIYATGSLAAQDRATLSAKVSGRVESIEVDLGSVVKQGDLLARIEKQDYELKRRQAEAALTQARARLGISLGGDQDKVEPDQASIVKEARALLNEATKSRDRAKNLRAEGVIPEAEVETAESAYQVAVNRFDEAVNEAKNRLATLRMRQAELELAAQQLTDTEIRAPFEGVIEQRQTSPGEFLNIGAPLITVVRVDPIRLRLEISERDAPRVQAGQAVHVRVQGTDRLYHGQLSRVSPVITRENRMLVAEADVPNPHGELRPGSFVKADIVVNPQAPGLFVPEGAVRSFAGIQKIFLVSSGKAVEKEVKLRRAQNGLVEILGDFKPGEEVVVDPGNLRNGQPVEVISNKS